jgi:hypothetical protein
MSKTSLTNQLGLLESTGVLQRRSPFFICHGCLLFYVHWQAYELDVIDTA